jgi:hypothetical protein
MFLLIEYWQFNMSKEYKFVFETAVRPIYFKGTSSGYLKFEVSMAINVKISVWRINMQSGTRLSTFRNMMLIPSSD